MIVSVEASLLRLQHFAQERARDSSVSSHQRSCKTEAPSAGDKNSTEAVNDLKIDQNVEEELTLEMVVEEVDLSCQRHRMNKTVPCESDLTYL